MRQTGSVKKILREREAMRDRNTPRNRERDFYIDKTLREQKIEHECETLREKKSLRSVRYIER